MVISTDFLRKQLDKEKVGPSRMKIRLNKMQSLVGGKMTKHSFVLYLILRLLKTIPIQERTLSKEYNDYFLFSLKLRNIGLEEIGRDFWGHQIKLPAVRGKHTM